MGNSFDDQIEQEWFDAQIEQEWAAAHAEPSRSGRFANLEPWAETGTQLASGFVEGVAGTAGLAADVLSLAAEYTPAGLLNQARRKIFGQEDSAPEFGEYTEGAVSGLRKLGLTNPYTPDDALTRIGKESTFFLGGAGVIPGASPLKNALLAVTSGAASGGTREMLPDDTAAPIVAALAVPTVSGLAGKLARGSWNLGANVFNRMRKPTAAEINKTALTAIEAGIEGDDLLKMRQALAERPTQGLQAYRTSAEVFPHPYLARLESGLPATDMQASILTKAHQINREAARKALIKPFDIAEGQAGALTDSANQAAKRIATPGEEAITRALLKADLENTTLGPGLAKETAGAKIRDALLQNEDAFKKSYTDPAYEMAKGSLRTFKGRLTDVASNLDDYVGTYFESVGTKHVDPKLKRIILDIKNAAKKESAPSGISQITRPFGTLEDALTPNVKPELKNLLWVDGRITEIKDRIKQLKSLPPDKKITGQNQSIAVLSKIRGDLESVIDTYGDSKIIRLARDLRREQGDLFDAGVSGKLKQQSGYSYKVKDSQVAPMYFNRKRVEDMQQFNRTFKETPEAVEALEGYVIGELRATAGKGGTLTAKGLETFTQQYDSALSEIPELKSKISSLQKAQSLLDSTKAQHGKTIMEFEKSALGQFTKADPNKAINAISSHANPAARYKELAQQIGSDGAAKAGLQRGLMTRLIKEAKDASGNFTADKLRNIVNDPVKIRLHEEAFGKDFIKAVNEVSDDLQSTFEVGKRAISVQGSQTTPNITFGQFLLDGVRARFQGQQAFQNPWRYFIVRRTIDLLKNANENQVNGALANMLLDPDKLLLAMQPMTEQTAKALYPSLKRELAKAGVYAGAKEYSEDSGSSDVLTNALSKAIDPSSALAETTGEYLTANISASAEGELPNMAAPSLLDGIAQVESAGGKFRVGPKVPGQGTAKGMYQLMDKTGKWLHELTGMTEPYDPNNDQQARKLAEHYIDDILLPRFGSLELALAGYNAGPNRVAKAIKEAGTDDWGILKEYQVGGKYLLPKQTREYPGKVLSWMEKNS